MLDRPAWIVLLFKRGHGLNAFRNRFALDLHREAVEEYMAQADGRRDELRHAAVAAIESDDPPTVVQALSFLLVAGSDSDVSFVKPLTRSTNDAVQKAAKTCLFELTHAGKECQNRGVRSMY
jgi:hypothetical protein